MTDPTMEGAKKMALEGKTIVKISTKLGVEWSEVASYLDADDLKSWQGAKKVITHRLKDLIKENDQSAREELAGKADKWIDYLYYAAKRIRRQVTRARKALDG